jgi:hypothetical protein
VRRYACKDFFEIGTDEQRAWTVQLTDSSEQQMAPGISIALPDKKQQ